MTIIPALPNVLVAYNRMLKAMPRGLLMALKGPQVHARVDELMGIFVNDDEEIPYVIFKATVEIRPLLEQNHSVVTVPKGFP